MISLNSAATFAGIALGVVFVISAAIHFVILYVLVALGLFLPNLAVAIRRLHDTDRSGWWVLINIVPLIGFIVYLVFVCSDSTPGDNQYGPSPKGQTGFNPNENPNPNWGQN